MVVVVVAPSHLKLYVDFCIDAYAYMISSYPILYSHTKWAW